MEKLTGVFEDQIQMKGNVVKWHGELVRENFHPDPGNNFRMKLGSPSESLVSIVAKGVDEGRIDQRYLSTLREFQHKGEKGQLILSQDNLNKKREDGKTDHRVHFGKMEEYPTSTPLEVRDIELIPSIWGNPSRVIEGDKGGLILETDSLAGDRFRIVVGVLKPVKDKEGNETLVPLQSPKEGTYYRTE